MLNLTSLQKQAMLWFSVGIGLLVLLYVLAPVLTPFLFAAILGYLLNPGVDWLERHRVPRTLGVLSMVGVLGLIFVLLLLVVLPVVQREVGLVIERLPTWLRRLDTQLSPLFQQVFDVDLKLDSAALLTLVQDKLGGASLMTALFDWLRSGWGALLSVIANLFLVPIVLFYLLLDWHSLLRRLEGGIPRSMLSSVLEMVREIDVLLSQFLRGQLLVMTVLAIYYSGALALAGFDTALPVGILTGLLVFIPYVGFGLGLILALLSAALQFGNLYGFAAIALIYGAGQFLESFWLTPRLVGERIGLHPLAVIFALLAFGELFGFFGVLLALPASAALLVALRRVRSQYLKSDFYRQTRR